ncbi:MAG TPA: insulinase family protein, partial [Polyangiaceae bacterium]
MRLRVWRAAIFLTLIACEFSTRRARAESATDYSVGIESYHELSLPNGLRAVIALDRRVPQVALDIEYAVGDALDPADQPGLAQLVGALLPKLGTRHVQSRERRRLFDAAGFKFEEPHVRVGVDTTALSLEVPAEALELALWVEADRMGFAAGGVTDSAVKQAEVSAAKLLSKAVTDPNSATPFWVGLGGAHPYGALVRPANFATVTAAVAASRLRFYNPATAVLVLVGDVDVQLAEQAIRRYFGPLPSAPIAQPTVARQATSPRSLVMEAAISARFAAQVWETPPYLAPDDLGLDVIAALLVRRLSAGGVCDKVDA